MKKYYFDILLLFSSTFYVGCTSTYIVVMHPTESQRDTITIIQLQQKLQDKTFKIVLCDNQQIQAENITFSKDSATYTILADLKQNSTPLIAIKKIERRLHFDGAFVGVFYGLLFGPIAGAIYGNQHTDNSLRGMNDFLGYVGDGGALGVFGGGIYGGIRGNIEEYIFDSDIDKHAP